MSDHEHITSYKTPSDTDSNSNSGSLFSRRYPDDLSVDSNGSKENSPSNLSSPKLVSRRTEAALSAQRRLLKQYYPIIPRSQPRITHDDFIDLATSDEKSNSDDEWFVQKTKSSSAKCLFDRAERSGNSQVSMGTTRGDIQKFLMKRLVDLRRSGQQKRKALYNADNGLLTAEQRAESLESVDIESKDLEMDSNDESKMRSAAIDAGDERKSGVLETANRKNKEDTLGKDWSNNFLQSQTKKCESLVGRKIYARSNSADNETDSSSLSGDSVEDESRASLVDDLLDDVAINCSGVFEYLEDNKPEERNEFTENSTDDQGNKDKNDESDDELIRPHRKPRKRRLLFSPNNSDDDEKKECDVVKLVKNIQHREADNGKDTCSSSVHKKESRSCDSINLLNGGKGITVYDKSSMLFDDHYRDLIHLADEASDEEDQQIDELKATDPSDDELEVFHKLEFAQKQKARFDYIDEEASLSGNDVGSDENDVDDDDQLDFYEAEEGDNDEVPDDETIREQLHKQWLKQQQDEENRKLLYWKDRLLVDGDLSGSTDRTFRFKLRRAKSVNSDKETDDVTDDGEDDEVDDSELIKRRREISKWKIEQRNAELHVENTSMMGTNLLLKAASKVVDKGSLDGNSQLLERADAPFCKNSLLHHRKSLCQVLNQTKIALVTKLMNPISPYGNEHKEPYVAKQTETGSRRMGQCSNVSSQ